VTQRRPAVFGEASSELTVADALDALVAAFAHAGCANPRADAEALLSLASGDGAGAVPPPGSALGARQVATLGELADRRVAREPLAYIMGWCAFRGLRLAVDPRVLIPRETSGPLVMLAHDLAPGARVHDVGTGSGALALAIKSERPDLVVSGSDISAEAIAVAERNRRDLGLNVSFAVAAGLPPGNYDYVAANLPTRHCAGSTTPFPEPELAQHQPRVAVFAGDDDLAIVEEVVASTPPETLIALEHTPQQERRVRNLLVDGQTLTTGESSQVTYGHAARHAYAAAASTCLG
jgi:release factor glutamine methyltransferase